MQACSRHIHLLFIVLITIPISQSVFAQNVGQSKKIQYGIVTSSKTVDLSSNAVPKGALIGGGIGLLTTRRGPSRQNRTRNVVVGAAAGAAIGAASSNSLMQKRRNRLSLPQRRSRRSAASDSQAIR